MPEALDPTQDVEYTEHAKLTALDGASQHVGEFMERLGDLGLVLCDYNPDSLRGTHAPTSRSIEDILASMYEIDSDRLEAEKRHMLARMRWASETEPVFAVSAAEVDAITHSNGKRYVSVRTPDGITATYGHLASVEVGEGQQIAKGDVVGRMSVSRDGGS